ncbi:MAG: hypothetical protein QM725_15090 [Lacibacter sp.]
MKSIFTLVLLSTVLLSSCIKTNLQVIDEREWLSQERGVVVYSDSYCDYFVVETYNGYSIVENWSFRPYNGDVLYGDFSNWGTRTIYNRSRGALMRVNIKDSWLSYYTAMDGLGYYCR